MAKALTHPSAGSGLAKGAKFRKGRTGNGKGLDAKVANGAKFRKGRTRGWVQ